MRNIKRLWSCFFAFRAFLATAVAPVSGALHPGHDRLAGHPLAVRRQAKVAHEVDEARGQVQLAAKLTGCIVIRKWMVVVVESFACKRNAQQQSRSREQESKPKQISAPGKPGILRTAVHVITSYPFHKTLMTHQQQAHWAIDSGHCFCLFRDKTCCIPIIYRPQGPRLFTDQTICVHGSHTGPIIQRSQARYNVLLAAHTLGMTSLTQPSANGIDLTWIAIGLRAPLWSDDFSQWCHIFL